MQLCSALTAGVPRGIPIGPYAFHLLAECVFDIIDRNLLAKKYTFCRFVDDFHIFCKTKEEARIAIYDLTNILDKGLQLSLQGHKSKILDSDEFIELAQHVLIDAPPPIMDLEKAMIDIIDRYSNGDRYRNINTACLTEEDLAILSQPNLETVLNSYLAPTLPSEPNFTRIRWFFRRLKQVGVPGAIPIAIEKLEQFSPAVADLAGYLLSARMNYSLLEWRQVGNEILHSLDLPIIQRSEYLTVILLDLFARLPVLNHLDSILQRYETRSSPMEKRKIVRIATVHRAAYWLPQIIEQSFFGDPWLRRSLIAGASAFLGKAERNNWLNRFNIKENKLDTLIAQWALSVTMND